MGAVLGTLYAHGRCSRLGVDLETEMGSEEEVLNAGFSEELPEEDELEPDDDDMREAEAFAFDDFKDE